MARCSNRRSERSRSSTPPKGQPSGVAPVLAAGGSSVPLAALRSPDAQDLTRRAAVRRPPPPGVPTGGGVEAADEGELPLFSRHPRQRERLRQDDATEELPPRSRPEGAPPAGWPGRYRSLPISGRRARSRVNGPTRQTLGPAISLIRAWPFGGLGIGSSLHSTPTATATHC